MGRHAWGPARAGSGAGSRWFLSGTSGEGLVVAAARQVPLDPITLMVAPYSSGDAPAVHDGVVALAQQRGVGQV
ncbi:MAG: hypothetical protein ABIO48_10280 [Pedococcus sp.]